MEIKSWRSSNLKISTAEVLGNQNNWRSMSLSSEKSGDLRQTMPFTRPLANGSESSVHHQVDVLLICTEIENNTNNLKTIGGCTDAS